MSQADPTTSIEAAWANIEQETMRAAANRDLHEEKAFEAMQLLRQNSVNGMSRDKARALVPRFLLKADL